MKKKSVVLLSGGLDSSVNLLAAHRETDVVLCLTFDYGQRAVHQEIRSARSQCERLGIEHQVVSLPWLRTITKTSLVNTNESIPLDVAIDDARETSVSAKKVWVPNRNGVFLNVAASFAEAYEADIVVPGFNREEAQTFPDNSEDFLDSLTDAFSYSTANQVVAYCYTGDKDKTEIAWMGRDLGLDFNVVWPCYFGGETLCGECESCLRFKRAVSKLK
jgi:7-cyano-7-deazaguanine synthase